MTPRDTVLRVQVRVARRQDRDPLAQLADLVLAYLDTRDPELELRLRAITHAEQGDAVARALRPGLLGRIRLWFRWRALKRALASQRLRH